MQKQLHLEGMVDVLIYACSFVAGSIIGKVILGVVAITLAIQ